MGTKQRFKNLANKFVTQRFADLTHDFTIEQKTNTPDGQGGFTVVWSVFANITGFIKTTGTREITLDDHIKAENVRKFSFQYLAGITTDMRIDWNGIKYNIHAVKSSRDIDIWTKLIASMAVAT